MTWIASRSIALGLLVIGTGVQARPLSTDDLLAIDRMATEAIAADAMPGLAIAVRAPDGTVIFRAYGVTEIGAGSAVHEASVFRLGSISKLVTSAMIMKLVEDGRLSLEQPVREILKDAYGSDAIPVSVTVEHLLNHTAGLPDYTREELQDGVAAGFFERDRLNVVLRRPPVNRAGEVWQYSDANFTLVSLIIEQVTGSAYDSYVEEEFAQALDLPSLRACDSPQSQKVKGYLATENGFVPEPAYEVRGLLGAGGLCSTASDLVALPSRLIESGWISQESLQRMLSRTILDGGVAIDYGLGIRRGKLGEYRAWGHTGGGLDGAWAAVAHYPDRGYSVAVVANGTGSELDASVLHARVAEIVLKPGDPVNTPLTKAEMASVVGRYSRGTTISCIVAHDGKLFRMRTGSEAPGVQLLMQESLTYGRADYPLDRIVFQASDGPAPAYLIYYDGLFSEYWVRERTDQHGPECDADSGLTE